MVDSYLNMFNKHLECNIAIKTKSCLLLERHTDDDFEFSVTFHIFFHGGPQCYEGCIIFTYFICCRSDMYRAELHHQGRGPEICC